jgi:hypothetical protein
VSERAIITAPATYPATDGIFVALQGEGVHCPTEARGLLTLKIRPGLPSAITTAWCASLRIACLVSQPLPAPRLAKGERERCDLCKPIPIDGTAMTADAAPNWIS